MDYEKVANCLLDIVLARYKPLTIIPEEIKVYRSERYKNRHRPQDLTEAEKEEILLRAKEDWTPQRIADKVGRSRNTVSSYLVRVGVRRYRVGRKRGRKDRQ